MTRTPTLLGALVLAAGAGLAGCAAPVTRTVHVYDEPATYRPASDVRYGSVRRIEEIDTQVRPSGGGAVLGGVIGGVVGNQFGGGFGRAALTALGAFGGAALGNNIEQNQDAAASGRVWRVVVDFDDGGSRSFDYHELFGLHVGERVQLRHGILSRA